MQTSTHSWCALLLLPWHTLDEDGRDLSYHVLQKIIGVQARAKCLPKATNQGKYRKQAVICLVTQNQGPTEGQRLLWQGARDQELWWSLCEIVPCNDHGTQAASAPWSWWLYNKVIYRSWSINYPHYVLKAAALFMHISVLLDRSKG